jgi:hypothetical protein
VLTKDDIYGAVACFWLVFSHVCQRRYRSSSSPNHILRCAFQIFVIRWEDADVGHVQFGTILRDIGAKGQLIGN